MAIKVHYEILVQEADTARWTLYDVKAGREAAIQLAQSMMESGGLAGVKIVKQIYDEGGGDYRSVTIYRDGRKKTFLTADQEDLSDTALCSYPDDFYTAASRKTIQRYLFSFLSHNRVTVTEVLYRPDLLDKLENTGTVLQHAVQGAAMAHRSSGSGSVQHNIKILHHIVSKLYAQVFHDAKIKLFPPVETDGFDALAAKLAGKIDGEYVLNGAIVHHLRGCHGWDDKLIRVMEIIDASSAEGNGGRMLQASIGALAAELVHQAAAIQAIIGPKDNFGKALLAMAHLLCGRVPPGHDPKLKALPMLCRQFAAGHLSKARHTMALRFIAELKRYKRLCPDSVTSEMRLLREIANIAGQIPSQFLNGSALESTLDLRSSRLIGQDSLKDYLGEAPADEQLDRMFVLESYIYGQRNKRQLLAAMTHIAESEELREIVFSEDVPVLKRLQRLAGLSASAQACDAPEHLRNELKKALDRTATLVADHAKLFEKIAAQSASNAEKLLMIAKLFSTGVLTDGKLAGKARTWMTSYISKPDFLPGYIAATKADGKLTDASALIRNLVALLNVAGIAPKAGFKAMVA